MCPVGWLGCVPVHKNAMLTLPCTHTQSNICPHKNTHAFRKYTHTEWSCCGQPTHDSAHTYTHTSPSTSNDILQHTHQLTLTNWKRHTHTELKMQRSAYFISPGLFLSIFLSVTLLFSLFVSTYTDRQSVRLKPAGILEQSRFSTQTASCLP